MSEKACYRYEVIVKVLDKRLKQQEAAALLKLSTRQIKRLCRIVREDGFAGLLSKRGSKRSPAAIDCAVRDRYLGFVRERYADFGPTLAKEYLEREHGFVHSVETLRQWMIKDGLWRAKRRRQKRIHPPRPRRQGRGELVQIDGSHHDWFEGRSGKCCLIAFIDDATSEVLGAQFFATETTQGYLEVLETCVQAHGVPLALYSDRHSIFTQHNPKNVKPTQFERALLQLEIEGICASTPQAKGRVERLFQTLQDRLCKALRLAKIDDMESANAWLVGYLAEHNRRFGVKAQEEAHRAFKGGAKELARICTLHESRQVGNGLSFSFNCNLIQILPDAHAPKGRATVDIAQYRDGRLEVMYHGHNLRFKCYPVEQFWHSKKAISSKEVNTAVEKIKMKEHKRLARLQAELALQEDLRKAGIYHLASTSEWRVDSPSASLRSPSP